MKITVNIILPLIALVGLLSCGRPAGPSFDAKALEEALSMAGANRAELEEVISHFSDDPFRQAAACRTIIAMADRIWYESAVIDSIKTLKINGKLSEENIAKWKRYNFQVSAKRHHDITEVDAATLIGNIELACSVWLTRPWKDNYSFDDFCEYILPYKLDNERPESWRNTYYERYREIADSALLHSSDILDVASAVLSKLKKEGFNNHTDIELPHLGAIYLFNHRVGYCRENCDIAAYALRSVGIPVATDFYVNSPSYNSRHFWNALIDTTGLSLPFNYTEKLPQRTPDPKERKKGKVYRLYFERQPLSHSSLTQGEAPGLFFNPHVADVSHQYFPNNTDVEVAIDPKAKWAFLSIFNGTDLEAVDIAPVKNKKAVFKYVENDVILIPATFTNGKLHMANYPILTSDSAHHILSPDTRNLRSVTLKRKYQLGNTRKFLDNLKATFIDVSSDCVNFRTIRSFDGTENTNRLMTSSDGSPVSCVRFHGPADKKTELAEMHFYSGGREVSPIRITSDKPLDKIHKRNLSLITDNIWHSFYLNHINETLSFHFSPAVCLDSVLFVPRNDDNFVRVGQDYELFYCDGADGWKSLGRKTAFADSINFECVPDNALLWLHNHSGGREERPFIYTNRQHFL